MAGVALERKGKSFAARQRVQSTATMPDGTGESGERRMNDTQRQNYRGNEAVFAWHDEARPPEVRERAAGFEAEKQEIATWFSREAAAVWAACGAFEWIALGYLGLSSALIATFAENLAHPAKLIGVQALAALIILALCRIGASYVDEATRTGEIVSTKFWHFWRHWYPHLFFLFCFEELAKLVHLVNPNWQDAKLIAFDHWMFGVHPSVWLEQFATPLRNDLFQLAYLTYFIYLLVLGGILYYRRE